MPAVQLKPSTEVIISNGIKILILLLCFCWEAIAGVGNLYIGGAVPPTLPLDLFPGATAAWSLVPLTSTAGNLAKVRRSTDDAVTNLSGTIDGAAIETWAGESRYALSNSFIDTLYDQTTNGFNLTQTNKTIQLRFKVSALTQSPMVFVPAVTGCFMSNATITASSTNQTFYFVFMGQHQTQFGFDSTDGVWDIPNFSWSNTVASAMVSGNSAASSGYSSYYVYSAGSGIENPLSNAPSNLNLEVFSFASGSGGTRFIANTHTDIKTQSALTARSLTNLALFSGYAPVWSAIYYSRPGLVAALVYPYHDAATQDSMVSSLQSLFSISNRRAFLLFGGDSIAAGFQFGNWQGFTNFDVKELSWPGKVVSLLNRTDISAANAAVGGRYAGYILSTVTNQVMSQYNPVYSTNIYVLSAGSNDIYTNGTAAQVTATISNICVAVKSKGFGVVLTDIIPRPAEFSGGQETIRLSVNANLSNNWSSFATAFVPISTNAWLTGPTNYQDGIHPNDLGASKIATNVYNVVRTMLP